MSTHQPDSNHANQDSSKLRWGWIVAGAVTLEVALIILFIPMLHVHGCIPNRSVSPVLQLSVLGFLISWWIVGKVQGRRVLHGALIGIIATIIYVGLCLANPSGIASVVAMYGPVLFVVGNGLRIAGSTAGAYFYRSR